MKDRKPIGFIQTDSHKEKQCKELYQKGYQEITNQFPIYKPCVEKLIEFFSDYVIALQDSTRAKFAEQVFKNRIDRLICKYYEDL